MSEINWKDKCWVTTIYLVREDAHVLLTWNKNLQAWIPVGGHIDPGETPEEAAIREIFEETTLKIELGNLFLKLKNEGRFETYFLAKSFSGTPTLSGPEAARNCVSNVYKLEWIELKRIKNLLLYPEELKKQILLTSFN